MGYLRLARPGQWVKNLFVLAGPLFGMKLLSPWDILLSAGGLVAFCVLSSGVYSLNDWADRHTDALHPVKSRRPIPSGAVSATGALVFGLVLVLIGLAGSFALSFQFGLVALGYLGLNILYSVALRKMVILDVLSVAMGFLLRAIAGAVLVNVSFSHWLLLATLFLALLIALAKRRQEIALMGNGAREHRETLGRYSNSLLDQLITASAGLSILTYALYTVSAETVARLGNDWAVWTTPIVVYAVFRFVYLVEKRNESPDRVILRDPGIIVSVLVWAGAMFAIIYWRFVAR
ncbi:MAG: decaprenyl-phosphate phosphoribosyltransferase [candidate division WOR-3 bacterium]